jgi:hypothetical protein
VKKIIFLDIDGVLISKNFKKTHDFILNKIFIDKSKMSFLSDSMGIHFDPICVENLNNLIDETEADIVITSSNRIEGLAYLQELFHNRGIKGNIIGMTPITLKADRSEEIMQWVINNGEPDRFLIYDDENIKLKNFIGVDESYGLTSGDVEVGIEILNQ